MGNKKKWLSAFLGIGLLAAAHAAVAATTIDLRMKLGTAAGVDHAEITNIVQADTSRSDSGNGQIEVAFTPYQQGSVVNFVGTAGIFARNHEGHIADQSLPTDVKYLVGGLSGSVGVSVKASENLYF